MGLESSIRKLMPAAMGLDFMPGGGIPSLTGPDVAAALGMGHVSDEVMLVGLVVYTKDETLIRKLVVCLEGRLRSQAAEQRWVTDEAALQGLARLAVRELVLEGRCQACGGTGWHQEQGRTCTGCEGSGHRQMSETYQAAMVGRSRAQWKKTWEGRLRSMVDRLNGALDRFNRALLQRVTR